MVEPAGNVFGQKQFACAQRHIVFGWDEINGIGLDGHLVFRLHDPHGGVLTQNVGHKTFIIGREVLNNDKAQSAAGGKKAEKLLQRLKTAGRRAQSDDKRAGRRGGVDSRHEKTSCLYILCECKRYRSSNACTDMGLAK